MDSSAQKAEIAAYFGRFEEASSGLGEKDVYAAFSRNKMLPIFVAAML